MRKWRLAICLGVAAMGVAAMGLAVAASAQIAVESKANAFYHQGKRIEALPFYEQLAKAHPDNMTYQERLADCLGAAAVQTSDAAQVKALRLRERDAAKRAVELGDKAEFVKLMAELDPDASIQLAPESSGGALLQDGEKAFTAGDFDTAMAKYVAASKADPRLYLAPLYAGDTAYVRGDLKTAAKWFARAIEIDPDRETAYRYWGDAMLKYGRDEVTAKEKFLDAVVAEPYNKLAWQGIEQWAQRESAMIQSPKIDRPAGPVVNPKKPNGVSITIDPSMLSMKDKDAGAAWLAYAMHRANYRNDQFQKDYPDEKEYRHTLKEEESALTVVLKVAEELKVKPEKMDASLRTLKDLSDAGMLECWILINGADQGIAQDYDAYRVKHRQLLHDYLAKYVVHGGPN